MVGNRNEIENMIPFLEKGYKGQQTKERPEEEEMRV